MSAAANGHIDGPLSPGRGPWQFGSANRVRDAAGDSCAERGLDWRNALTSTAATGQWGSTPATYRALAPDAAL